MVLGGEVVLAGKLGRDGDEQSAALADGGEGGLPGFELGHAVGTPAAAEEEDDERADGEEVGGVNEPVVGAGGVGERSGGGVGEIEGGGDGADGEDAAFDAGEEESLYGFVCDGETARAGRERASGW